HLPQEVEARGMRWLHLPIPDGSVPSEAFEGLWREQAGRFHASLKRGGRVLVHCRGGLGRSGMVAARLLVESGMTPEKAIVAVRQIRPRANETPGQEAYVHPRRGAGVPGPLTAAPSSNPPPPTAPPPRAPPPT